ncbi:hypothetical protein GA8_16700 [Geobacillus sp. A8]|nr:hypothetical protein GA8_16700 [Geobacillus sp. A8]
MEQARQTRIHGLLLLIVAAVFVWSAIRPTSYAVWALEVAPALVGLVIVMALYQRFRLTTMSYVIIAMLAVLMLIGGHYIYSKVPFLTGSKMRSISNATITTGLAISSKGRSPSS